MRSLMFVALDKDDRAVKRMQSFVTVQPGEVTSCVGCHEPRTRTPATAYAALTCPTLIIGGDDDPMVPVECQIELARAFRPGIARFEQVEGAGHGVVADAPEKTFELIREFLTGELNGTP